MDCPKCDTSMESMGYGDELCPKCGHAEYAESETDFNARIYGETSMSEVELNSNEVKQVYDEIQALGLEPFDVVFERKSSEYYYELNSKQYRLIYDGTGDWFCDIIYQGQYKEQA